MARPTSRPIARAVAAPRPRWSRLVLPAVLLTLATALLATVASAQETPTGVAPLHEATTVSAVSTAPVAAVLDASGAAHVALAGPRLETGVAGVRATARPADAASAHEANALHQLAPADELRQDERPGLRRNVALIAVGLASIAIGSAVDDGAGTVLVLGGAGLSLYGLYQILR